MKTIRDGLALQAAIGQGNTAVTPLQLAAYAAALARGGERPALHFAEKAVDANGKTVWGVHATDAGLRAGRPKLCSGRSAKG